MSVDPFAPVRLGPVTLRNRFVKAATFEGASPDHVVTDELIAFHRRVTAGGVGLTTLAYCAVSSEGCGTPNEIILTGRARPGLARLADAVHAEGAALAVQIGHAGAVAVGSGQRGVSPSPMFSPVALRRTRVASAADIRRITGEFRAAARVVADAGADAVEVHLGHGYLLSEFLSPRLNRRTDGWGGSTERRARFAREVCGAVRDEVGGTLAVTAKLNMSDGVPGGLGIEESIEVARLLEEDDHLDAIELTGGSSLQNPMYLFRGDVPTRQLAAAMPRPMGIGVRLFGRRFLRHYPFEEAYFLERARRFRRELALPLILLGGINRLDTVERALAEGFDLVAMGRALLMEPDLVERMRTAKAAAGVCTHCNQCMAPIYGGTHCVLVARPDRS
jgi:2,4-dienoyl-CoA reductase-like NADH-dependent reductase (Old Yellow Enzyme family)